MSIGWCEVSLLSTVKKEEKREGEKRKPCIISWCQFALNLLINLKISLLDYSSFLDSDLWHECKGSIKEKRRHKAERYILQPLGRKEEKKEGGGAVASQLEKDWITAVRKVSANKNSLWPLGSVLTEHPHPNSHLILPPPPPPFRNHHIYTPAQTKPGLRLNYCSRETQISKQYINRPLPATPLRKLIIWRHKCSIQFYSCYFNLPKVLQSGIYKFLCNMIHCWRWFFVYV